MATYRAVIQQPEDEEEYAEATTTAAGPQGLPGPAGPQGPAGSPDSEHIIQNLSLLFENGLT